MIMKTRGPLSPTTRALGLLLLVLGPTTCFPAIPEEDGECVLEPATNLDCSVTIGKGPPLDASLVGYSCSGTARPDSDSTYAEGIPSGLLCADQGLVSETGRQGYCCSNQKTQCSYDPAANSRCTDANSYGVECWGNNRPESLNAKLTCSNGVMEQGLANYCCTGRPEPSPCAQDDTAGCKPPTLGFHCNMGSNSLPRGEHLGANKSRADYFHPTCTMPFVRGEYDMYCCYMPSVVPKGGSCVNHTKVPGCAPGRFGFACYGPESPEEDYPPMNCPEPGFPGLSYELYDATLYCCDMK